MRTIIHVIIKRNVGLLHKCRSLYGEHFTMAEGQATPEAIVTLSVHLTQPPKYVSFMLLLLKVGRSLSGDMLIKRQFQGSHVP